jgi:hypothetical protein
VIPVGAEVTAACELLGLDPLHVANEGRFVAFVAPDDADRAVALLRRHAVANAAAVIGSVTGGPVGQVSCRGPFGVERLIDMLNGEQFAQHPLRRSFRPGLQDDFEPWGFRRPAERAMGIENVIEREAVRDQPLRVDPPHSDRYEFLQKLHWSKAPFMRPDLSRDNLLSERNSMTAAITDAPQPHDSAIDRANRRVGVVGLGHMLTSLKTATRCRSMTANPLEPRP